MVLEQMLAIVISRIKIVKLKHSLRALSQLEGKVKPAG
jgi:hypothetical protein